MAARALGREIARNTAEGTALELGRQAVGHQGSPSGSFIDSMAESVVLATAWFTVRMICQVSYKAIKSFRETKKKEREIPEATEAFSPAYGGGGGGGGSHGYVPAVSAEDEANDESCVPWGPVACDTAEPTSQATGRLRDDDRLWVEELRRAVNSRTRDNLRLLRELQELGDKVDNMPLETLYDNMRHAMKLLLEYQQNPHFRDAHTTLQQADEAAKKVYTNERSLVMSLSALRLRIVITYLHCTNRSKGLEPSMDDKDEDKRQCELYLSNALTQGPLESLCRKFLASRDSPDMELRERVERETMLAFDILLEVISSVYLLEPFRPSQGPLPEGAPAIVVHALSIYCKSALGSSLIYADLARALKDWESTPERQEKWALHCLYKSTGGPGWACNEGWDRILEANLASLYGVSTTAAGRVTKVSLGANNLEGRLPLELEGLKKLQELSLPGNKLFGKIPAGLWGLPCLRVVALHGNRFTGIPPGIFRPAARMASAGRSTFEEPTRRRRGLAGSVVARDPSRLEMYQGEWLVCSWKITNTGGVAFAQGTRLSRGEEHSILGGAEDVLVNPLAPGEEQTVSVMLQAPNYEAWALQDEWALVGEGLDFVDEDDAKAQTPSIRVVPRPAGRGKASDGEGNVPTLANTVFVAANRRNSRGSSQFSSTSSSHQRFHHSDQYSSHHYAPL